MAYDAKTNWRNNDIVTADDLNRIERGIADSASPADDRVIYVAADGSDATGTGELTKPFRTIQKAIDSFPTSNNLSKLCVISLGEGSYPGFTLSAFKRIEVSTHGEILITGDIVISAGKLTIVEESDTSVYIMGGAITMTGGYFECLVMLGITNESMSDKVAVNCTGSSHFSVPAEMVVANCITAINCAHSFMTIRRLLTDVITTGIICDCGIVQLGDDVIQATTAKFVTKNGGRIYVGAQLNMS